MKKYYETPKMEIVLLEAEDVIRTSGETSGDNETPVIPIGEADELDMFEHHDLI